MRGILTLALLVTGLPFQIYGQGEFTFRNPEAPTRLYSPSGPLAGPGIWGQALVGTNMGSLTPIGLPVDHRANGTVNSGVMVVPGSQAGSVLFIQLAAWDGLRWGSSFANVPPNQIGYTDIVPVTLTCCDLPEVHPVFTQPAIVPVPEPNTWALLGLGSALLWCATQRRRK